MGIRPGTFKMLTYVVNYTEDGVLCTPALPVGKLGGVHTICDLGFEHVEHNCLKTFHNNKYQSYGFEIMQSMYFKYRRDY